MKINNPNLSSPSLTPKPPIAPVQGSTSSKPTDGISIEGDTYTPSPEFVRLLDLVRDQPEIREDRVRDVSQRLAAGYYLTNASADETAAAILASGENG